MRPEKINIHDYIYTLPDDRIARFPLEQRDQSRLLVYKKGEIGHRRFYELPELLPAGTLLVFNETKVIRARILLQKETGAAIEIFVLDPLQPSSDMQLALSATGSAVWKCMIGNKKRFREEDRFRLERNGIGISVQWENREQDEVRFSWTPASVHFAEIIELIGSIPIPPYLGREPEEKDSTVYQTVYSQVEGSVAAPTAGLHFTQELFTALERKNIEKEFLTLHVGAGTFRPVKAENALEHEMHAESVFFTLRNIRRLIDYAGNIVPVGTTSLRSLESLYWFGVGRLKGVLEEFVIPQYFPYDWNDNELPSVSESLQAVLDYMEGKGLEKLSGTTSIYMVPGYRFRVPKALVTNFHQPGSTLILLVAAWIGEDWKKVYSEALQNDYRFLSYGDSCLLMP